MSRAETRGVGWAGAYLASRVERSRALARRLARRAPPVEVTAEERARLRALGYLVEP